MQQIAKVMSLDHSVHESERDVFMIGIRTFDAHQNPPHMDINMLLGRVNSDLIALHTDLVALDLWDATTIVSISDFGRTITSNGIGTDHAWGGNNFILVSIRLLVHPCCWSNRLLMPNRTVITSTRSTTYCVLGWAQ